MWWRSRCTSSDSCADNECAVDGVVLGPAAVVYSSSVIAFARVRLFCAGCRGNDMECVRLCCSPSHRVLSIYGKVHRSPELLGVELDKYYPLVLRAPIVFLFW